MQIWYYKFWYIAQCDQIKEKLIFWQNVNKLFFGQNLKKWPKKLIKLGKGQDTIDEFMEEI